MAERKYIIEESVQALQKKIPLKNRQIGTNHPMPHYVIIEDKQENVSCIHKRQNQHQQGQQSLTGTDAPPPAPCSATILLPRSFYNIPSFLQQFFSPPSTIPSLTSFDASPLVRSFTRDVDVQRQIQPDRRRHANGERGPGWWKGRRVYGGPQVT